MGWWLARINCSPVLTNSQQLDIYTQTQPPALILLLFLSSASCAGHVSLYNCHTQELQLQTTGRPLTVAGGDPRPGENGFSIRTYSGSIHTSRWRRPKCDISKPSIDFWTMGKCEQCHTPEPGFAAIGNVWPPQCSTQAERRILSVFWRSSTTSRKTWSVSFAKSWRWELRVNG